MKTLLLSLLFVIISFQFTKAQNHPPVAVADSVDGYTQAPLLIDVLANDYDADGDSLFITSVFSHTGDAIIMDGKLLYKAEPWTGTHSVKYTISDGQLTDIEYAYINVSLNPDAPVAVADTFEFQELTTEVLDILSNDYDSNGDDFKIYDIYQDTYCTATIAPDSLSVTVSIGPGEIAYFEYRIIDLSIGRLISERKKVTVYLTPNPDRPVAVADTVFATGGIPIDIPVLSNDYDPQGEAIEVYYPGYVQHGTIEKFNDFIRYTPELSYSGHEYTYYGIREVIDTAMYSAGAKLIIFIEKNPHCPIGLPDVASGMSAVPVIVDVLANDYDPDGDLIEIAGASITPDNKLIYTPPSYVTGADSIYYRVREINNPDSYSEPVKVKINVQPNPAFPWGVNDTVNILAGNTVVIHPLENDVHNGFDSLKIRNVFHYGQEQTLLLQYTDQTVTVSTPYQAEGLYKLRYMMVPVDSTLAYAGRGDIFINIEKRNYYDSLTVNNVNAGVNADGYLFSMIYKYPDGYNQIGQQYYGDYYQHFKVPADQAASTIFANRFIIGGYDQNNALHTSGNMEDWKAGPVSAVYDEEYNNRYLKLWKLTKEEVEYHKQHYYNSGYQALDVILNWPGSGNTQAGQAQNLAPYFDHDANGYYNPQNGDYPLIRGDECIFFMCNDNTVRLDTTGQPLNVEMHGMVYAFNATSDTALFNTIFVHYDIINRSENIYHDCYSSVFNDYDIGGASDDYYRTDVTRASVIGYNGKDIDTSTEYEQFTYGDNPPAQSVTVLAGPFIDPDGNDNPTGSCDESINGINFGNGTSDDERHGLSRAIEYSTYDDNWWGNEPVTYMEMYNFMNGIWDDDTPILYGGNGHQTNGATGPEARYMFPGTSDPMNYGTNCQFPANGFNQGTKFWTEEQTRNRAGDRRGLASMGPFTLAPGQVQEIELAYCTGLGNNGAMSSVNQLLRNIDSLRYAVAHGQLIVPNSSLGIRTTEMPSAINIYPNPASDLIVISNMAGNGKGEYSIYNMFGVKVSGGNISGARPTVKIESLTPGMYIIRVTNGETISAGKFVKK
jgi:hypothetical protein